MIELIDSQLDPSTGTQHTLVRFNAKEYLVNSRMENGRPKRVVLSSFLRDGKIVRCGVTSYEFATLLVAIRSANINCDPAVASANV